VSEADQPAKLRLFFAIWPPPSVQAVLGEAARDLREELGGKATRTDSIHLTLVFLGDVPAGRLDEIAAAGDAVHWQGFDLMLDTSGCFAHNRIAWVAPSHIPAALLELAAQLQARMRALGFTLEERPYSPHITLLRKAVRTRGQAPLSPTCDWPVEAFMLMRSELDAQGSRYSVLRRWLPRT
jgi:2'-5' RNA ligase